MEVDLIAAIATPPGSGGVGIIRISGVGVLELAAQILLVDPKRLLPNKAIYTKFINQEHAVIDQGIAIFFQGPNSFTGEDVLELHAHGGVIILNLLLNRVIELGAKLAEPGEFTKRAFLNNKIDLIQAESIAKLISAESEQAALAASKSLQGEFSTKINGLFQQLINLRSHLEAIIDFPEEELDPLSILKIQQDLDLLIDTINQLLNRAKVGELLTNGITATIIGKPNVGKSSLLNYLSGKPKAIVTEIPGTTRDLITSKVNLHGLAIEFVDTAGFRNTEDPIEKIGITMAMETLDQADLIILMLSPQEFMQAKAELSLAAILPLNITLEQITKKKCIILVNKIDLIGEAPTCYQFHDLPVILVSIKERLGLELLINTITALFGLDQTNEQSVFMANTRHIQALHGVLNYLSTAKNLISSSPNNLDLLAEELRAAQSELGKITGVFSNEDLLTKIFSEFCIGK